MKILKLKFAALIVFSLIISLGAGCKSTILVKSKNPPPGQMKKETGSKSAKPFAPGQQKKQKNE